ncbi:mucin-1 isoform X2 [Sus scrofa]|uniref:mucin-1 isoform X2 n=1 Tax=Sus scrofa TaxID=9823 RepID=UPI000A2B53DF|nr:mucin-1 isoform X2 [Sus scrofa]
MTRDIQAPFFFGLLLLPVLTGEGPGEGGTSNIQSSPMPSSTDGSAVYKEDGLLGLFYIKFRPGSVLVELILAFQDSAAAHNLKTQFDRLKAEAGTYNLTISEVSVIDAPFPSSAQPGSGVPGWGIALLVLVCILVALAIIYVIALAVCQCRRKNCGQLDIFPTRDAYHPMSEYPTYHTHGRYVPPGSTKRNPYEQVSAGNGGGSLSYSNLAATSANL